MCGVLKTIRDRLPSTADTDHVRLPARNVEGHDGRNVGFRTPAGARGVPVIHVSSRFSLNHGTVKDGLSAPGPSRFAV
jgi:hypothetical protein